MNQKTKSIEDLEAIRSMMEKSSKFVSLSGLSGVFAGLVALLAAGITYFKVLDNGNFLYNKKFPTFSYIPTIDLRFTLFGIASLTLIIAIIGALFFSIRKAKKEKHKIWNKTSKQLLINLMIPLATGGIWAIILAFQNNIHLLVPITLIFYGLALVNAGKFTFNEIFYLGICEIILGLLAAIFRDYGLLFWTIGFGAFHIFYGILMYLKYDRK